MGASHARALVTEGARVVAGDILDDEGKALAEELGQAARFVHLDVTQPDQWKAAVELAVRAFGTLNVLVNNAGSSTATHCRTSRSPTGRRSSTSTSPGHFWVCRPRSNR
jgi:NAD(P)-dependent dehydrogenase (short-subunit alcohol dehydrogenase family)